MNKIRRIICGVILCTVVMTQAAFAEQIQLVFYGKTTAYKQISVLALDKDLPYSDIKGQNIKYVDQIIADSDGCYSISLPFKTEGDGYVFRSSEVGRLREIDNNEQKLYVSESGNDLNGGSEKTFSDIKTCTFDGGFRCEYNYYIKKKR